MASVDPDRPPDETATTTSTSVDHGGPVVVACVGHRCLALNGLARQDDRPAPLQSLRTAVRTSEGGLMITTGCMGPCSEGAVMGVGRRVPAVGDAPFWIRGLVLLGGMERPQRVSALTAWLALAGPEADRLLDRELVRATISARPSGVTPWGR